jgi:hypothetical protein
LSSVRLRRSGCLYMYTLCLRPPCRLELPRHLGPAQLHLYERTKRRVATGMRSITERNAKTDFAVRTAKPQKRNSAILSDTSSSLPNSVGWTPKPTAAPFAESPLELHRRSEISRDTYAEFDGNAAYPFTCANGYACSANLAASTAARLMPPVTIWLLLARTS